MEYTGSVYVAVVGTQDENGECRDSIERIVRRANDSEPHFIRATKGFEARQMHLNKWYTDERHPFILLLDSDMVFPEDTLEKLRAHKKPYVSGFYMRRSIRPYLPVWYEQGAPGEMPMRPFTALIERDKWYPIGASGWGCMLLHRDVVTATQQILKGENEILEDDMDIMPYDLKRVMAAIDSITSDPAQAQAILREEIKPIRGDKSEIVGSDIRFPFYARLAGFELIGDTGVECKHMTPYPVGLDDWMSQSGNYYRDAALHMNNERRAELDIMRKATA